jgi:hypothetical protein
MADTTTAADATTHTAADAAGADATDADAATDATTHTATDAAGADATDAADAAPHNADAATHTAAGAAGADATDAAGATRNADAATHAHDIVTAGRRVRRRGCAGVGGAPGGQGKRRSVLAGVGAPVAAFAGGQGSSHRNNQARAKRAVAGGGRTLPHRHRALGDDGG